MNMKSQRHAPVYRYKSTWQTPQFLPEWGTLDAIAILDGCIPIGRSARLVPISELDSDGFLPLGLTPDDFETAA